MYIAKYFLIPLIGCFILFCNSVEISNNSPVENEHTGKIKGYSSSGCLSSDVGPRLEANYETKIPIIQKSDSGTIALISFSTYCATEFFCTNSAHGDTFDLIIQNKTQTVTRCVCPYEIRYNFGNHDISTLKIRVVLDLHRELNSICTLVVNNND